MTTELEQLKKDNALLAAAVVDAYSYNPTPWMQKHAEAITLAKGLVG